MLFSINIYLIHVSEREYRYGIVEGEGEKYYIMLELICVTYLPLSDDVENILKWGVKNGLNLCEDR